VKVRFSRASDGVACFSEEFRLKLTDRKVLSKQGSGVLFSVTGELSCELPDPESKQKIPYVWHFKATIKRSNGVVSVVNLPHRDKFGTYGAFVRALIWNFLKEVV